jgi:hypothetical protein
MKRLHVVAAVVAVLFTGQGLFMLVQPEIWYQSLPSVPHTGPLNVHFVRDIGAAYLASGFAILLGMWRSSWRTPAAIPAFIFIGLHAVLHLIEWGHDHPASSHEGWMDRIGLYAPALFLLYWMWIGREEKNHA